VTPRTAAFGVFFVNGATIGTWIGHIPWIQVRFDYSKSALGLVLLAMSAGVIVALPLMGQAIVRLGSARATRITGLACALMLPVPLLTPEPWLLPVALVLFGAACGAMDVSMNAQGSALELRLRRPIMSSLHAGWSLGGLVGAAVVTAGGAAGIDPRAETIAAAAVLVLLLAICLRRIGDGSGAAVAPSGFVRPSRGVIVLALLCLLIMLTEGAIADWGGVYLAEDLGTSTSTAALAFAAFAAGMTVGRLIGDSLNRRLGATILMRGGSGLAAVALGAVLLSGVPAIAVVGFLLVGLGVANSVPLLFSAAGQVGCEPGPNIAAVSALGSIGFLAGPPFIGFLADATSLPLALSTLCVGLVIFTLAARAGEVRVTAVAQPEAT
jgi:MFS family permease